MRLRRGDDSTTGHCNHVNNVSRHRYRNGGEPTPEPEDFWSLSFPKPSEESKETKLIFKAVREAAAAGLAERIAARANSKIYTGHV
jgi:hypothetical protein